MKVQVVQVGDRLSLEMDAEGLEAVRSYVEATYADAKTKSASTYSRVSFGGSEFLHEDEWDEPYLLSQTAEGDALLRSIAEQFS
jgi:hypothetical protein